MAVVTGFLSLSVELWILILECMDLHEFVNFELTCRAVRQLVVTTPVLQYHKELLIVDKLPYTARNLASEVSSSEALSHLKATERAWSSLDLRISDEATTPVFNGRSDLLNGHLYGYAEDGRFHCYQISDSSASRSLSKTEWVPEAASGAENELERVWRAFLLDAAHDFCVLFLLRPLDLHQYEITLAFRTLSLEVHPNALKPTITFAYKKCPEIPLPNNDTSPMLMAVCNKYLIVMPPPLQDTDAQSAAQFDNFFIFNWHTGKDKNSFASLHHSWGDASFLDDDTVLNFSATNTEIEIWRMEDLLQGTQELRRINRLQLPRWSSHRLQAPSAYFLSYWPPDIESPSMRSKIVHETTPGAQLVVLQISDETVVDPDCGCIFVVHRQTLLDHRIRRDGETATPWNEWTENGACILKLDFESNLIARWVVMGTRILAVHMTGGSFTLYDFGRRALAPARPKSPDRLNSGHGDHDVDNNIVNMSGNSHNVLVVDGERIIETELFEEAARTNLPYRVTWGVLDVFVGPGPTGYGPYDLQVMCFDGARLLLRFEDWDNNGSSCRTVLRSLVPHIQPGKLGDL